MSTSTIDRPLAANETATGLVPRAVDAQADLGAHAQGEGLGWNDSIYVAGQVHAEGHTFGYVVHVLHYPLAGTGREMVTITDTTTGWFRSYNALVPAGQVAWDADSLDLRTPALTWTGNAQHQHLSATTPWGALDLDLDAEGPPLYYGATGAFPWVGLPQWQYALPQLRTTGRLIIEGTGYEVTGETWLDRQWGPKPDMTDLRWTWFPLAMPGGDKLAVWDLALLDGRAAEESWATLLHPDGTHELVPVTPVAEGAGRLYADPDSGFVFPTEWRLSIPSRAADLIVTTTSQAQVIPGVGGTSYYEGAATVSGTYHGEPVNGRTYVEQVGNWSP